MSLSPAEVWERLLNRARAELPESTYRTWLEPTEALALDGDTVVVGQRGEYLGLVQLDTVVAKIRELREEHAS